MLLDHLGLRIPGVVDDDCTGHRIVVGRIETLHPHRGPIFAVIILGGRISAVRGRVGAEAVAEPLQVAGMGRVGPAAVGDQVALHLAGMEIDDVEPRLGRWLGEIDDSDLVAVPDPVLVHRRLGPLEQLRIDSARRQRKRRLGVRNRRKRGGRSNRRVIDQRRKADAAAGRREHCRARANRAPAQQFPAIQRHLLPSSHQPLYTDEKVNDRQPFVKSCPVHPFDGSFRRMAARFVAGLEPESAAAANRDASRLRRVVRPASEAFHRPRRQAEAPRGRR